MRTPARRAGLAGAAAVLALALLGACATQPPAGLELRPLAPGVYLAAGALVDWGPARHGHVANLGVVVGERCAAVIDSGGTRANGVALKTALRRVTALPVCYVINTHAHPDHVLGNEAFVEPAGAGPVFVGHRRLPAALATRGPYYLNALQRDFPAEDAQARLVAPTQTVEVGATLTLDLGGRRLALRAWPTAHTDADLSVLDERSGTLWLGDLLFAEHLPVLDGRLEGWLAAMAELRGWRGIATVVPGHGPASSDWPAALDAQQRYLERLRSDTRAAIRAGLTLRQAVEHIAPDRPGWRLQDSFHARNVTAAYAELEWED